MCEIIEEDGKVGECEVCGRRTNDLSHMICFDCARKMGLPLKDNWAERLRRDKFRPRGKRRYQ